MIENLVNQTQQLYYGSDGFWIGTQGVGSGIMVNRKTGKPCLLETYMRGHGKKLEQYQSYPADNDEKFLGGFRLAMRFINPIHHRMYLLGID